MSRETAQFLLGQLPDGFCDETVPLGDAVLVDQGRADARRASRPRSAWAIRVLIKALALLPGLPLAGQLSG